VCCLKVHVPVVGKPACRALATVRVLSGNLPGIPTAKFQKRKKGQCFKHCIPLLLPVPAHEEGIKEFQKQWWQSLFSAVRETRKHVPSHEPWCSKRIRGQYQPNPAKHLDPRLLWPHHLGKRLASYLCGRKPRRLAAALEASEATGLLEQLQVVLVARVSPNSEQESQHYRSPQELWNSAHVSFLTPGAKEGLHTS